MTEQSEGVIRVLLAEDHTIVREGLKALLAARPGIEVIAEVGNGRDAVTQAQALRPDVVVMDLNMPEKNGLEATQAIRDTKGLDTQVLILSMHSSEEYVRPALRAGASGYLLKGSGLSDLVSAIEAIAGGNAFFSPEVARIVLQDSRRPPKSATKQELSQRETQVLKLVAEGKSSPEIAKILNLSVKTIEGHRSRIMAKLETRNVVGLVRYAIKTGLVTAD